MGADLDLQHGGVVGAGKRSERLSAPGAPLLGRRQFEDLLDGGEVGVVPAYVVTGSDEMYSNPRKTRTP